MTRLLFKEKSIAKNWTFLGRIYIKKATEGDVIEIEKKEDLVDYDIKGTLREMKLL